MKALVAVSFQDDGPSFSSIGPTPPRHDAKVIEVDAETEKQAEVLAREKVAAYSPYVTVRRSQFERWIA